MSELNNTANKTKSYTIASFYNSYILDIEPNSMYDIDYTTYRSIVTDYFKYLRDLLIAEGKLIKLPYRLGTLLIIKHKPKHYDSKSMRIDYQATKLYNKLILLDNMHSNMYKYRAYWSKYNVLIPNKTKYMLILTRDNKRDLARRIKNKLNDYLEL